MDLNTVTSVRSARSRSELGLAASESFLAGGSWIFSEPQLHLTGLVDLMGLDWPALTRTRDGLSIGATCTFAQLAAMPAVEGWTATPLFAQCCAALLGSFKVWNTATVGGNICLALPAGPMTSLSVGLDATAVIWAADGSERRMPVIDLVIGVQETALRHGDLLRSVEVPETSLTARAGFRKIALSALGRSGTVVIARLDADGTFVVTVSAGTPRPEQRRFTGIPTAGELAAGIHSIERWYDDAHGAPDWREAMTALLAEQLREELGAAA